MSDSAAVPAELDPEPIAVRRALLSVSDKTGIVDFALGLERLEIEIVSTGGTAKALRDAGIEVRDVSELTGAEEILGGRVKTLHPRIHAGLLAVRSDPDHKHVLEQQEIEPIDLVCVNLYPFERTAARRGVTDEEVIEDIDVGGPTMIRAAAKNHRDVAVVVTPESYDAVIAELEEDGTVSAPTRHWLANEAFALTARYDAAISSWFGTRYEAFPSHWVSSHEKFLDLSYGENPHQRAALYIESGARSHILSRVAKLHGKGLSFNNVLDLDAARGLMADLDEPAAVIVKHNNPCGVAVGADIAEAYEKALATDPQSAFGGVVALNRPVDAALAERLNANFVEVLIAPEFDEPALDVLRRKEAIRILLDDERRTRPESESDVKRVRGGLLVQDSDDLGDELSVMQPVTENLGEDSLSDLVLAWKICRHVRSNAIVIVKDGATVGIGAGQMSRVDSVRIAVDKAHDARDGDASEHLRGSVVASDAFFPFADGPQSAIDAGAVAIVQPGGSKRDDEVIAACDAAGVAMLFTGRRHFRH